MQVQVNPQVAARNVAEFIKSHGGNAQYMEVLELMARICGFTSYHALKIANESQKQAGPAAPPLSNTDRGQHRQGQAPKVVHQQSMVEWNENSERVPGPEYDLDVGCYPSCLHLTVKETGATGSAGAARLDVIVEIQNGVPCAHLTNDAGGILLSAFANPAGMYFKPEDGIMLEASKAKGSLAALAKAVSPASAGFVVEFGEEPSEVEQVNEHSTEVRVNVRACDTCGGPVHNLYGYRGLEYCKVCEVSQDVWPDKTVADLGRADSASVLRVSRPRFSPADNRLDTGIHVELFMGQSTWRDFLYIQVSECRISGFGRDRSVDIDSYVANGHSCYTAVPTSTSFATVRKFAQDVCQVASFFLNRWSPADIKEVLWLMVEDGEMRMAGKVREMTERYPNVDECYAALVAEFGIAKDPRSVS
jgi:hypothetical protein